MRISRVEEHGFHSRGRAANKRFIVNVIARWFSTNWDQTTCHDDLFISRTQAPLVIARWQRHISDHVKIGGALVVLPGPWYVQAGTESAVTNLMLSSELCVMNP